MFLKVYSFHSKLEKPVGGKNHGKSRILFNEINLSKL